MKIAFISDIHGNAIALDAVLADIKQKKVEKVYVLGDLCYRGPEPQRSIDFVRSLNTEVIKGNADEWIVRGVKEGEVPPQALEMNKEREWTLSQLDQASIDYLSGLPTKLKLEFGDIKLHAFHATPKSLFEVVFPDESEEILLQKMMTEEADLYVYAHIHKPYIRFIEGKCIVNIGSVGLPFDGLKKSSYMILEITEGSFQTSIVRVKYDINMVINQLKNLDYPNSDLLSRILYHAKL
jgi:putative phosphoesterase